MVFIVLDAHPQLLHIFGHIALCTLECEYGNSFLPLCLTKGVIYLQNIYNNQRICGVLICISKIPHYRLLYMAF